MRHRTFLVYPGLLVCLHGCDNATPPEARAPPVIPLVREAPLRFERKSRPLRRRDQPGDTLRLIRSFGGTEDFSGITGVALVGKHLVVVDRFMSPHLAVIDLGSGLIVHRLGRDGQGPGEFRVPIAAAHRGGESGLLWIYDHSNRRM